jgi:hypothetical protein
MHIFATLHSRRPHRGTVSFLAWLLLLLLPLSPGCSNQPKAYPAGGKVVFKDGTPLKGGRIELKSREHPYAARGRVDADGQFSLTTFKPNDGAIAGPHQVIVLPETVLNVENPQAHLEHVRPVDKKLSRYATTWLEIEIDPQGDNLQFVVEIE